YVEYGCYREHLVSITRKGRNGQQEIADMMERFRANPPQTLGGVKVVQLLDYQKQVAKDLISGGTTEITLPKSNVLQFVLEDGSKISARPSGTEPKIKFYFSVKAPLSSAEQFDVVYGSLEGKIDAIVKDLGV
ncbi:MAG: phospho-sugar mutase, partial [Sphingobacteriales bacterium]